MAVRNPVKKEEEEVERKGTHKFCEDATKTMSNEDDRSTRLKIKLVKLPSAVGYRG